MKNKFSNIFIAVIAIFSVGFLASCRSNSCIDLNCQQSAPCIDDHCQCPTGYEGPECTITSNSRFIGLWTGKSKCGNGPYLDDTVRVFVEKNPNIIKVISGIGNTSALRIIGTAGTPEATFLDFNDGDVWVNPYLRVDGNQMKMTIVTVDMRDSLRSVCEFEGRRIPGTDTMAAFTNP